MVHAAKDGGMMIIGVYVTVWALWKGDIVESIWKSPSELIIDAENSLFINRMPAASGTVVTVYPA